MPLPEYQVNVTGTPPSGSEFTNYDTLFALGQAENAGFDLVYSPDQFETVFGTRQPASPLWDGLQVFFREGGYRAYVAATTLTGLDADLEALLPEFTKDLGPGILTAFGHTTSALQASIAAATGDGQRIALLDAPDSNVAADIITAAGSITGQPGDRFSAMFAPWDVAPGLTVGTTRIVPPSARIAGNLARNSAAGKSPGVPAAGVNGIARYIQGLSQPAFSDGDRTNLNGAGVNVSKLVFNQPRTYGWRSLASQTNDADWSFFNASRTIMVIKSVLSVVAENFQFNPLDGAGIVTKKFQARISAAIRPFWPDDLYGATFQEACNVDTGPAVNTAATFAAGQLFANVGIRVNGMNEQTIINIAKVPITEALAA